MATECEHHHLPGWCKECNHTAAIAAKDAEIARLKAENERVTKQRDRLAWAFGIEVCRFEKAMSTGDDAARERARNELEVIGLRIVGGRIVEHRGDCQGVFASRRPLPPREGSNVMTESDRLIAETLRLDAEATSAPWEIPEGDLNGCIWAIGPIQGYDGDALDMSPGCANAALVSSYRTSAPRLARMLRVALEKLDEIKSDRDAWDTAEWALLECEKIAKGEA